MAGVGLVLVLMQLRFGVELLWRWYTLQRMNSRIAGAYVLEFVSSLSKAVVQTSVLASPGSLFTPAITWGGVIPFALSDCLACLFVLHHGLVQQIRTIYVRTPSKHIIIVVFFGSINNISLETGAEAKTAAQADRWHKQGGQSWRDLHQSICSCCWVSILF
jgi:hypothetical protein